MNNTELKSKIDMYLNDTTSNRLPLEEYFKRELFFDDKNELYKRILNAGNFFVLPPDEELEKTVKVMDFWNIKYNKYYYVDHSYNATVFYLFAKVFNTHSVSREEFYNAYDTESLSFYPRSDNPYKSSEAIALLKNLFQMNTHHKQNGKLLISIYRNNRISSYHEI